MNLTELSWPALAALAKLNGLTQNFASHGFRRLVFLNGHGGNAVPGRQAVFELRQRQRQRDDLLFLVATYWGLGAKPWESNPAPHPRAIRHACEWETSMMLRLAPHLDGDHRTAAAVEPVTPFTPVNRGWIIRERSSPGHIGSPHLASAEKGEHLFSVFAADFVALLEQVVRRDGKSWNG